MAVDAEVLLECLDYSFAESVFWWVVGSREAQVNVELSVQLLEELLGKLQTTIRSYMSW